MANCNGAYLNSNNKYDYIEKFVHKAENIGRLSTIALGTQPYMYATHSTAN